MIYCNYQNQKHDHIETTIKQNIKSRHRISLLYINGVFIVTPHLLHKIQNVLY